MSDEVIYTRTYANETLTREKLLGECSLKKRGGVLLILFIVVLAHGFYWGEFGHDSGVRSTPS